MKCEHARAWIQLYLDSRLEAHRQTVLARHLHVCAACRMDLATYQLVTEGMGASIPLRHPEALTRSIMARVRRAEAQSRMPVLRRAVSLGWADALLSAVLATVMTLTFLYFEPALRLAVSSALALSVASLTHDIGHKASSWPSLAIWLVWASLGITLALWFAGGEVRAGWRRAVIARLSR